MNRYDATGASKRSGRTWAAALTAAVMAAGWTAATPAQQAPAAPPRPADTSGAGVEEHHHHHPATAAPVNPEAQKYFTDVVLVDQDGEEQRLYSDLLAGKTVVINAFFTTCTGVCPVMSGKLASLQKRLGDRLGKDVFFVSLSVDPETDTVEKLHEYAQRFHAGPGWSFLGGKKENVDWALYRVGQYVEDKEAHTNLLIVGNERTGLWKKVFGLSEVDELERIIKGVADDTGG